MTKIIQRHDTAANWTAANPVLAAGEMGVEYQEGTVTFTLSDAVTTNGTPTFNNGLVSNFSTSNYYSMNTMLVEEMVVQFTTGSNITQGQYISTYPSLNIENGKLRLGLSSGFQQLMAVSTSTQYTIKVINYSSKIEIYSNSTLIATFDTSLSSGGPRFGSNIDGYPFLGTIDFRNTSINGTSLTNKTEVFSGTSRFKFGNGSSAWSDLEYATSGSGGSVDAYTKAETDELLTGKQDKLTAVAPIRIYDYTPDYTYVGYTKDESNNLTKDDSSEHYVLMPYNKNYLYKGYCKPDVDLNNTGNMGFQLGKIKNDGTFQPILYAVCTDVHIKLTDNAEWSTLANYSATGGNYNMSSNTLTFLQCYIDGTNVKVNTPFPFYASMQSCNANLTVSDTAATRLAEITHVLYYNNSSTYPDIPVGSIGYYNLGGFINDSTYSSVRQNIINDSYPDSYPNLFEYIAKGTYYHRIEANKATSTSLGVVQPDGTSITVNEAGVISAVGGVQSPTIQNILVMTQAEYDALTTKNDTVLYLIREETV